MKLYVAMVRNYLVGVCSVVVIHPIEKSLCTHFTIIKKSLYLQAQKTEGNY
jgi:hypothetical protein